MPTPASANRSYCASRATNDVVDAVAPNLTYRMAVESFRMLNPLRLSEDASRVTEDAESPTVAVVAAPLVVDSAAMVPDAVTEPAATVTSRPSATVAGMSVALPSVAMASLMICACPPAPVSSVRILVPSGSVDAAPEVIVTVSARAVPSGNHKSRPFGRLLDGCWVGLAGCHATGAAIVLLEDAVDLTARGHGVTGDSDVDGDAATHAAVAAAPVAGLGCGLHPLAAM